MLITAKQIRLAMTHLEMTLERASSVIGVGRATLQRLSTEDKHIEGAAHQTVVKIKTYFEKRGLVFSDDGQNVLHEKKNTSPT